MDGLNRAAPVRKRFLSVGAGVGQRMLVRSLTVAARIGGAARMGGAGRGGGWRLGRRHRAEHDAWRRVATLWHPAGTPAARREAYTHLRASRQWHVRQWHTRAVGRRVGWSRSSAGSRRLKPCGSACGLTHSVFSGAEGSAGSGPQMVRPFGCSANLVGSRRLKPCGSGSGSTHPIHRGEGVRGLAPAARFLRPRLVSCAFSRMSGCVGAPGRGAFEVGGDSAESPWVRV